MNEVEIYLHLGNRFILWSRHHLSIISANEHDQMAKNLFPCMAYSNKG